MSLERSIKGNFFTYLKYCPKCNGDLDFEEISLTRVCERHHKSKRLFKCNICKSQTVICMTCWEQFQINRSKCSDKFQTINNVGVRNMCFRPFTVFFSLGVLLSVFLFYYTTTSEDANLTPENENLKIINKLRNHYPSQKNETWYHFMSVLEKRIPTVKSIIFLHGEDKRTSNCLINELISIYTKNESIKNEEISFNTSEYEVKDYGIVLEHCRQIVKRFKIFITDLNKVNGNIARIFHSLCDEVSSDIKPSLFIFTLMYNKRTEDLKPIERATTTLKEAWNDLPKNEIFPLLSRIVKNIIDIIPEKKCN